LPIRQFIQKDRFAGRAGWQERMVALSDGELRFGISPVVISETVQATLPEAQEDAKNEDLLEVCPANAQIIDQIKTRFEKNKGRRSVHRLWP